MAESQSHEEINQPIEMSEDTRLVLRSSDAVPNEIDVRGRKYYPKEYKAEGFKGVVWQGIDEYKGDVAIKFTVFADYLERSYLEEAIRARDIATSEYFARFLDAGVIELQLTDGAKEKFIVFVEQWINGATLSKFVTERSATPTFLLGYVRGMCNALRE